MSDGVGVVDSDLSMLIMCVCASGTSGGSNGVDGCRRRD